MATTHLLSGSTHHLIRTTPLLQSSLQWRNTNMYTTLPSFNLNFPPLFSSHSIKPFKLSLKCSAKPPLNPKSEPDIQPQVPDPIRVDDIMDTILNAVKELATQHEEPDRNWVDDIKDTVTSVVEELTTPVIDPKSDSDTRSKDPDATWVDDVVDSIVDAGAGFIDDVMDTIIDPGEEFINQCSKPKSKPMADTRPEYPDAIRIDDNIDTILNAVEELRKLPSESKPKAARVDEITDTIRGALKEMKMVVIHQKPEADTRSEFSDPICVDEIVDTIRNAVNDLKKPSLYPKPEVRIRGAVKEKRPSNPKSDADIQPKDPNLLRVDDIMDSILNAVEALKNPAIAQLLMGVLMTSNPFSSWADLGGLIGGSSSSSRSYSSSSRSYSSSSSSLDSGCPITGTDIACIIAFLVLVDIMAFKMSGESIWSGLKKTTVVKLQVGLLGSARSLQKELNSIAETANTSTPEGLRYILTESAVALLRLSDHCISANSFVDVENTVEKGEKLLNKISIEERAKFDEETLVNVNNMRRKRRTSLQSYGLSNEYIVVTILVAAEGDHKLPTINGIEDLKDALKKIGSIPSSRIAAVEVLWTPQDEDGVLSEKELLEDYPHLKPIC